MPTHDYPYKNLVFEGGGVKGVAYGGVFEVLEQRQITRIPFRQSEPAREAAGSVKPGVERSGTPGTAAKLFKPRGAADSGLIMSCVS